MSNLSLSDQALPSPPHPNLLTTHHSPETLLTYSQPLWL